MQKFFKYHRTAVFFTLLLMSGESISQNPKRHSFEIGPEAYYLNYTETTPSVIFGHELEGYEDILMEENGIFYGVTGAYTFRGWVPASRGLTLRAEGRFATGNVDYEGSTWGGEPLTLTDIEDHTMELRSLVGLGSTTSRDSESFLYTGFGYRYLNDDLSDFPGGYERESNYYYIPIGINITGRNQWNWLGGMTFELDFLLSGLQKSHLSDAGLGYSDVKNKQKTGWGLRGSLKFIFPINEKVDFVLEPFMRGWVIDKSEVKIIEDGIPVYEPKQNIMEAGINIVVRF